MFFTSLWCFVSLWLPNLSSGQEKPTNTTSRPAELVAVDPDIRGLLDDSAATCDEKSANDKFERLQKAVSLADKRGLIGDRALAEALMASTYVGRGELELGFATARKAMQDSIDAKNEVLEAEILISLAAEAQVKGNSLQATDMVTHALKISAKTGSLYEKAHALGELGKLQLTQGKIDDAAKSLNEALNIDRLNGYQFEATHLVYRGYYLGITGKLDDALDSVNQARAKALAANDPYAFLLAGRAYAYGLVQKGKPSEAIQELTLLTNGNLLGYMPDASEHRCLAFALQYPIFHLTALENLATILEVAKEKEKELNVWKEVYAYSRDHNIVAGEAEAAQTIAELDSQYKNTEDSLKYYSIAIDLDRRFQNDTKLIQAEVAQTRLLEQAGRSQEALSLITDVNEYAKRHNLRLLEFGSYLEAGQIYYSNKDLAHAQAVLERAEAMIRPGPYDSEINNQGVIGLYARMADIYKTLGSPTRELIALDKEFFTAFHIKDEKTQQVAVDYLDVRLKDLHIRELVEQKQKDGSLSESLLLSYVLYLRDGSPTKPTDDHSNWQRILSLPFEIINKPGGDKALVDILDQVGSLLGIEKLSLFDALSRYYVGAGDNPAMAEKYAVQAEAVLSSATTDVSALKVESSCVLAVAYSREGKGDQSTKKAAECLSLAKQTKDAQTIRYAHAAIGMAQLYGRTDLDSAKESLEELSKAAPEQAAFHVELATALASGKLYDQVQSELDLAVKAFVSQGQKKAAAEAYALVSRALTSDTSERAKTIQLKCLMSSASMYHESHADAEEGSVLVALGDYYLRISQAKQGIESYTRAFDIAQKLKRDDIAAQALFGLGNGTQAAGNLLQANGYYQSAVTLFHSTQNPASEAFCLTNLAKNYATLGDADKALLTFQLAKSAVTTLPEVNKYFVDYALADFYRSQGQFENALQVFKEAVDLTTEAGDFEHAAYSHLAIASSDELIGNWEEAMSEIETARSQFEQLNDKQGEAFSWSELVEVYSERESPLKDFDRAQECYRKAKELDPAAISSAALGEIYLQTGRYMDAENAANELIRSCEKDGDTTCRAHGLLSLAEAKWHAGDLNGARSAFDQVPALVAKAPNLYLRGRMLYGQARLLVRENRLAEALASYKDLITLIEQTKGRLDAKDQRSLSETYGYIYDELVSLLYNMSKTDSTRPAQLGFEAFEYAEINKARQFGESWGRVFVGRMKGMLPADLRENEQTLFSRRDHLVAQLDISSGSTTHVELLDRKHLEADLSSTQDEIRHLLGQLRQVAPQYAAVAYPEPVQISQLPLRQGETLVEFKMTDDATFAWMIRNQNGTNVLTSFYKISRPRTWFVERLSVFRKALNSGQPELIDWKLSEELFAELFPAYSAKVLMESSEIVFIPDDALFVLPFEVLSPHAAAGSFVFLTKATTYYPSAVALRLSRTASHGTSWERTFLGIADPVTDATDERFEVAAALGPVAEGSSGQDDVKGGRDDSRPLALDKLKARGFALERLPGTAAEMEAITSLLRAHNQSVDVREGVNATKNGLLDTDLSKFRFLHFATHGLLPIDTGITEPSLVLSYDGVSQSDMFLSMSDILGLKLTSESVVLSACNTGSGQISRTEGVMSLGRAFLAAGSSSVTVSLWQVSDESTALLMKQYYQSLLGGKRKSVALAEARNAVFTSGQKDPYFWAPFIVIGE